MLDIITLIILGVIAYRLAVLFVDDSITEPIREFFWRIFPIEGFIYEPRHIVRDAEGETYYKFLWIKRPVVNVSPTKYYKTGELLDCVYCASFWTALAVTVAYNYAVAPVNILDFLAVFGAAELVNNLAGRR